MSFEVSCETRVKAGLLVRRPDESCLILFTRLSDAWSVTILIGTCGADDSSDSIVVLDSVTQPLQDYDAKPLAASIPVGTVIKAEAPTIGGRKTHAGHGHRTIKCQENIRPSDQGLQGTKM
jgi:hypothetical protein